MLELRLLWVLELLTEEQTHYELRLYLKIHLQIMARYKPFSLCCHSEQANSKTDLLRAKLTRCKSSCHDSETSRWQEATSKNLLFNTFSTWYIRKEAACFWILLPTQILCSSCFQRLYPLICMQLPEPGLVQLEALVFAFPFTFSLWCSSLKMGLDFS